MKRIEPTPAIVKATKLKPEDPCPKCGATAGWLGPHYERATKAVTVDRTHPTKVKKRTETISERLAWACKVCGYARFAKTKDNQ